MTISITTPVRWIAACAAGIALSFSTTALAQHDHPEHPKTQHTETEAMPQTPPLVYVRMETSMGNIDLELNAEKAPISVANFLGYTDRGDYDGTIFHRVIENFMIQCGAFLTDDSKRDGEKPIENEWKNGLSNTRGTLAMARLGRQPNSATNQFFINVTDNEFLDQPRDGAGYAVFGKVAAGMEVIDAIRKVKTGTHKLKGGQPMGDWPETPVVLKKVRRMTEGEVHEMKNPTEAKATTKAEPVCTCGTSDEVCLHCNPDAAKKTKP